MTRRSSSVLAASLALAGLACGDEASNPPLAPVDAAVADVTADGESDAGPRPQDASTDAAKDAGAAPRPVWITAYYAGWMESHLPIAEIDMTAISHVAHFAWTPQADGTIDKTGNGWSAAQAQKLVAAAHPAGVKVLLTVGGAFSQAGFRAQMKASSRAAFVKTLVAGMQAYGYDGIDLDMEPVDDVDAADFDALVGELRTAIDATGKGRLLTAAVAWNKAAFVPVQKKFDQLNLMTYDTSGPWQGWETWHNAPLHNGGLKFKSTGDPLPSCETVALTAVNAGVDRARVGIGAAFYGYVWHGANGPNQPISGVTVDANVAYSVLMDTLYTPAAYKWQSGVEAPYLSIGSGAGGKFVSYDDEKSLREKVAWVRAQGLGGMIVWELGGGYRANLPVGKRDALLQAIKAEAFP